METKSEIRIYVACLAAYNNGILHGRWIDADQTEKAIHDHEGFESVHVEEYAGIARVAGLAAFITEHGRLGAAVLAYHGGDIEEARRALEDSYAGCYANLAEFAQELTEETTVITESLRFYIDYERIARDMAISDVTVIEIAFDQVHVFWNR